MSGRLRATALCFVVGGLLACRPSQSTPERARPTYPSFEVTTASGTLALSDLEADVVVVYFGYTACPDICPTTLAALGAAFQQLPKTLGERATTLFVSVDPERDTPERLAAYARFFHSSFRAGTSTLEALDRIAEDWGVYFRKAEDETSALGYTVDHSTQAFLWVRGQNVPKQLPHGMSPSELVGEIRAALDENPASTGP